MTRTDQKPLSKDEATKPTKSEPDAEFDAWQDDQTRRAIKEADAGDFATAEELKETVRKFVPDG